MSKWAIVETDTASIKRLKELLKEEVAKRFEYEFSCFYYRVKQIFLFIVKPLKTGYLHLHLQAAAVLNIANVQRWARKIYMTGYLHQGYDSLLATGVFFAKRTADYKMVCILNMF